MTQEEVDALVRQNKKMRDTLEWILDNIWHDRNPREPSYLNADKTEALVKEALKED